MICLEGSLGITSVSLPIGGPLVSIETGVEAVSCVEAAFEASVSFGDPRFLMIESNCYHSWSNLGSI